MKFETIVGLIVLVFLVLIFLAARASMDAKEEVTTNCTKTTLVYFNKAGYPQPVYDCGEK